MTTDSGDAAPALDRWRRDLEPLHVDGDRHIVPSAGREGRLFGAPVMAQSVVAAAKSVGGMLPTSLHTLFLRAGTLAESVDFGVERLREGRRFATRRVTASQAGRDTVTSLVTFSSVAKGIAHQEPMPSAPPPDTLPSWWNEIEVEQSPLSRTSWRPPRFFDLRSVGSGPGHASGELPWRQTWIRPESPIPDDPILHAAAMVLASDTAFLATVGLHYGLLKRSTSLDHSFWWYGPPRFDDWLLYVSRSPSASGSRSLTIGQMFTPAGALVAAVTQETFFATG